MSDLAMGLELRQSASLLQPGQSRLLRNWSLREPGALVTFPGWDTFSTTSLGARRIQGAARVYLAGASPFTVAADNGKIYKPSDGGVWGSEQHTGLHASNAVLFPHDRTFVAAFDGDNIPVKSTDGATWTQLGIAAPSVAPVASAVAGGSLIDAHTYEVSYGYEDTALGVTGNESATDTQAVSGGNLTVRVAVTASADPQVDAINLYVRDVTAGETVRRFYATYANTTTNRDITANTWSSNDPAPSDHTVPVADLVSAVIWKNRWWAWIGNRLYFTQIFEPQSWPSLFYIDIPFERGDTIAAVIAQGDTLIVWGTSSQAFLIIGQTSLDFEVRPALGSQAGALGPRAVAAIEAGVLHAAAEGVYIFDGASDRLLTYNIDPGWQDYVNHTSQTDLAMTPLVYHGLTKEVRIGVTRLYPWGTAGEWVLDLNRTRTQEIPAWTSTDRPVGGYISWNGNEPTTGSRGRLFSWNSAAVARLYEENIGHSADGASMVCDYEGATHATGGYVAIFAEGAFEVQPTAGTFALTAIVDSASTGSQNVSISGGVVPWDDPTFLYDDPVRLYDGKGRAFVPFVLPMAAEGRTFALRWRYTGATQMKVFTYAVQMQPEPALSGVA